MEFVQVLIFLEAFIIVNSAIPGGIEGNALGGYDIQCQPGTITAKCTNCTHLQFCFGGSNAKIEIECAAITSQLPYCAHGACSSEPDSTDVTCRLLHKFKCTNSGYMPDPSDCGTFHHCKSTGAILSTFKCPENYVFDIEKEKCVPSSGDHVCKTRKMACSSGAQYAVYGANEAYYTVCKENLVYRCEDTVNEFFDQSVKGCVPHCKEEKTFEHTENATNYYHCAKGSDESWDIEIKTCPSGTEYNSILEACETVFK